MQKASLAFVSFILATFFLSSNQNILTHAHNEEQNNRPIIAILAQDVYPTYNQTPRSYIAASYVKFIEASGARVVPVPSHLSQDKVEEIFNGVNGVLFPGGGIDWSVSGYFKHAKYFFNRAIEANQNGDFFPIWGTCLGFEALHVIAADDNVEVLSSFSASDISLPLNFTNQSDASRMYGSLPKPLRMSLEKDNITYNHHSHGISPQTFIQEKSLRTFFKVLSTNQGKKGKTFISSVEAFDYPFYGTQWHPEKNNFEHNTRENIPHSFAAIEASQFMANFFVNEARKSKHKFTDPKMERSYLIYNYSPTFTGDTDHLKNFEQCYFFEDNVNGKRE